MHPLLHSVFPTLQRATADPRLHWRLLDTHGQVWVSFLWGHCSFLLGPGRHKVVCTLQESVSPVLCKFWWLYGGVNGDLLQEGLCHTQVCCTQTPAPVQATLSHTPQETPKHSPGSVSVGSLGPGVHKVCLSPLRISGSNFAPPTILPGLLLCPWTWGIFFWWNPTFSS